jgi:uncharacterized protein with HEPN domain
MLSERAASALRDIAAHIDLAVQFTAELDPERFTTDLRTVLAVTRCLEIISEASRRLPDALKSRYPEIPWPDIAGAGNVYRHDYEAIDPLQIWDTVHSALPPLRAVVAQELAGL